MFRVTFFSFSWGDFLFSMEGGRSGERERVREKREKRERG